MELRRIAIYALATCAALAIVLYFNAAGLRAEPPGTSEREPISDEEKARLIAEKAAVGLVDESRDVAGGPASPVETLSDSAIVFPAELQLESRRDRLAQITDEYQSLVSRYPELAHRFAYYLDLIRAAEAALLAPAQDEVIEASAVHLGSDSVYWLTMLRESNSTSSTTTDPTNLFFFNEATSFDVEYDLRWWTRPGDLHRWEDACGGTSYWLGMRNVSSDPWTWVKSRLTTATPYAGYHRNLQPIRDKCHSGQRHHVRLFGMTSADSEWGDWTIANAHRETAKCNIPVVGCPGGNGITHTVNSWYAGENRVVASFRSSSGALMWFVESIYYFSFGNSGTYDGQYHDGVGTGIELVH
jgi:hypothetical protein